MPCPYNQEGRPKCRSLRAKRETWLAGKWPMFLSNAVAAHCPHLLLRPFALIFKFPCRAALQRAKSCWAPNKACLCLFCVTGLDDDAQTADGQHDPYFMLKLALLRNFEAGRAFWCKFNKFYGFGAAWNKNKDLHQISAIGAAVAPLTV